MHNDPDGRNPIKGLLKKFGDDGVKIVARTTKGNLKPISRVHAEKLLKDGKTVMKTTDGASNKVAKKLMKDASDKSKVVRHDGHELTNVQGQKTGKVGFDHFQKKSGDGSHVLYDNLRNLTVVGAVTNEGTSSNGRKFAENAVGFGATMTDVVENAGTKVFGNNSFGELVNELNPVNLGISELFKSADNFLNDKK